MSQFRESIDTMPIPVKLFHKIETKRIFKNLFKKPVFPKSGKDPTKKEDNKLISLMGIDVDIFNICKLNVGTYQKNHQTWSSQRCGYSSAYVNQQT